ncbi:DUF4174 domain-containing protein [Pseudomonas tremae]|uniref:DUF4174 domain-containing protein n=4 Tax=Pseudomonas syringae group TaxID=136849 RepID=A0AA40P9E4_9PSED|nr:MULTISPECIES: DUF4174 domain-containing protein [Pseudomonas syringae group]KOP52222.1 tyrosyl-trna synthetase [Pseudomonas coronafaciens pv. porri]KOP56911.1 tyrosyl-trna synthetase [Pseudomonas coronafaciens pv. porri]KPB49390.1 Uncharacterized protein AC511_1796 [Pseudomonas coronafaciens pv. oryzae]KPW33857.1 Uncharacterized protein ALO66_01386 [Pseudomonas coronafaciens pv. atropurpurea]KPY02582.1 Uncharacterized protein ALO57_03308 [Pseudomonas coronafaciens pv. oryzae]
MLIRSLTLATLLVATGTALAADENPLVQERGTSRPLIIIAPSTVDPTLVKLKKALDEPANREAFSQRHMVLYTIVNTIGERNGKTLDAQSTMALIRELKLGAGVGTKVILVGKDGEKKIDRTVGKSESIDPKEIFATIDQMPMREQEASAPPPQPEAKPAPAEKPEKPGKPVKGGAPGKALDD